MIQYDGTEGKNEESVCVSECVCFVCVWEARMRGERDKSQTVNR